MDKMEVPLTNSTDVFIIDSSDYDKIKHRKWRKMNNGYVASGYMKNGIDTFVLLHRFILDLGKGRKPEVDHIDRDKLNNTRNNLRITDRSTNVLNCGEYGNRDLPKGVYQISSGRYRAMGRLHGKLECLGVYDTVEEAVKARQEWNPLNKAGEQTDE